jgi:hypothetical protein
MKFSLLLLPLLAKSAGFSKKPLAAQLVCTTWRVALYLKACQPMNRKMSLVRFGSLFVSTLLGTFSCKIIGFFMQTICLAVPILTGKTDSVRAIFKTIREERIKDCEMVQNNAGIEKEQDFLQVTPMGNILLFYIESKIFKKCL